MDLERGHRHSVCSAGVRVHAELGNCCKEGSCSMRERRSPKKQKDGKEAFVMQGDAQTQADRQRLLQCFPAFTLA